MINNEQATNRIKGNKQSTYIIRLRLCLSMFLIFTAENCVAATFSFPHGVIVKHIRSHFLVKESRQETGSVSRLLKCLSKDSVMKSCT